MQRMGVYEAKTHFSELVDRVGKGESVVITRHGEEVARLVPPEKKRTNEAFAKALAEWRKTRKGMSLGGLKVRGLINKGRR